jgi:folate-dependent phosphoribosylglycinamide formyltransferase PurN
MIVLLGGAGETTRIVYHALVAAGLPVGRAFVEAPIPRHELLRRRSARLGLATVAGQVPFQAIVVPALARMSRSRIDAIKNAYGLDSRPVPNDRVCRVSSVNTPEVAESVCELMPAVIAVTGTRIIARQLIDRMPAPLINLHAGTTPRYRGVHGGYWALANGEPHACGVTVHRVDAGIDTGPVLAHGLIHPEPDDNFATYPYLQLGIGLPLLADVLRAFLDGVPPAPIPTDGQDSRLYSHPTLMQYVRHRVLRGIR